VRSAFEAKADVKLTLLPVRFWP